MASENRFFSFVLSLGSKKRKDRTLKLGRKWEGGGLHTIYNECIRFGGFSYYCISFADEGSGNIHALHRPVQRD